MQYCEDMLSLLEPEQRPALEIEKPSDVWKYVELGNEIHVHCQLHDREEPGIFFSIESNCDWETEHGLSITIRDGEPVCTVGQYDGHLLHDKWLGETHPPVYRRIR